MTHQHDPHVLRATMRVDLTAALKTRDTAAVSALRTAIAAIDNAESVDQPARDQGNAHIAGAASGLGATEAARRALSPADVLTILRTQIDERTLEADRYAVLGQAEAAERLRGEADVLAMYL